MKILCLLVNVIRQGFYAWAISEIRPTHADVPKILIRRAALRDEYIRLINR